MYDTPVCLWNVSSMNPKEEKWCERRKRQDMSLFYRLSTRRQNKSQLQLTRLYFPEPDHNRVLWFVSPCLSAIWFSGLDVFMICLCDSAGECHSIMMDLSSWSVQLLTRIHPLTWSVTNTQLRISPTCGFGPTRWVKLNWFCSECPMTSISFIFNTGFFSSPELFEKTLLTPTNLQLFCY